VKNLNIDKSQVAQRFAQAGQSYTEHAVIQKQIAQHLFDLIQQYCPELFENAVGNVLEIGCGSGNLSHLLFENVQIHHLVLNDLYTDIQQHFPSDSKIEYLIGDIEQLEFPQYLDLITSSSALQWVQDLDGIFQKAFDSLNQGLNSQAYFCFSTFGQQNLQEIKTLTGQGLEYLSLETIQEKLKHNGFEVVYLSEKTEQLNFLHPQAILQHLKFTGVTATASKFRWTKQSLQQFYLDYSQFSNVDGNNQVSYQLTYHPIFCIARRVP